MTAAGSLREVFVGYFEPIMKMRILISIIGCLGAFQAAAADGTRLRLFAPAWRDIGAQRPQEVARKFTVIYGHLGSGTVP